MGFKETMKGLIGIETPEETITEEEIEREKEALRKEDYSRPITTFKPQQQESIPVKGKSISFNGTSAFKLVVIEPKSFDECPKLVDSLKGRRPIIINLEKIETETAKKIFDFLSGATYALNGGVQKVANNIFIFAPESVDISSNQEERGFEFSMKNNWGK